MKKTLKILGMHCKSCEMLIKSELEEAGVKVKIDSSAGNAIINFDESKTSLKKIKEIILRLGYQVE